MKTNLLAPFLDCKLSLNKNGSTKISPNSVDDNTNKKYDKQMMSEPEYFKIRPSIREDTKFTHQVGEAEAPFTLGNILQYFPTQIQL